jgi:hypothetical protein
MDAAADPPALDHLAERAAGRLSVALVAGKPDARREVEAYAQLYRDLGIRTRLWRSASLGQVLAWLEEDRKRRRAEAAAQAGLAAFPDEVVAPRLLAIRAVELARIDLRQPDRTHRGAALLEWVQARCPRTQGAEQAAELLRQLRADGATARRLAEQTGDFRRPRQAARALALERQGRPEARKAWQGLARSYPGSAEARAAAEALRRLDLAQARQPYLGLSFAGDTSTIQEVKPGGPAGRAGLRAGDRVLRWGGARVDSLAALRAALAGNRPGDRVAVSVSRGATAMSVVLVLGSAHAEVK